MTFAENLKRVAKVALFPAHDALQPAIVRIVLGVFLARNMYVMRRFLSRSAHDLESRPFTPSGLVRLWPWPIDPGLHDIVLYATIVLAVLFTVGFLHRFVAPLLLLCATFVLSYQNSFGFIYHTHQLVVIHLFALCFAPASDRLSVDALLRPRLAASRFASALLGRRVSERAHWRYGWPIQFLLLMTGVTYWIAGVAKLVNGGGFGWATHAVLLDHIANNAFRYIFLIGKVNEWTFFLHSIDPRFVAALALGSLVLELAAPFLVVDRRLTLLYGIAFFLFHRGVKELMGIDFPYQLTGACFVAFVRWDLLFARVSRLLGRPSAEVADATPSSEDAGLRKMAAALTIVSSVALGVPGLRAIVTRDKVPDDFLFSNYGMFSKPRPEVHRISYVRAQSPTKETKILPFFLWSQGGMNSALSNLGRLVRSGDTRKICNWAAKSIAGRGDFSDYDEVEVVTDRYIPAKYFGQRDFTPERRKIESRCPIER